MHFFDVNATVYSLILEEISLNSNYDIYKLPATYITATAIVGFVTYWLLYVPCIWVKQLEDVSYDMAMKHPPVKSLRKRDAINRLRRLRKTGIYQLPPPYPNGWYSILESQQLKRGEVANIFCLGENIVVYRSLKNEVFALDAYCPHMGANMGIGGKVIGENIECPFHQWQFEGSSGKCTKIPYSSTSCHNFSVRRWIVQELNDHIFIWYHAEKGVEPWNLPEIREISSQDYVYHGRNEFYVSCHIQEIPENGADMAHFTAIHNSNLLAGGKNANDGLLSGFAKHKWKAEWKASDKETRHVADISLSHSIELIPKVNIFNVDVVAQQIGPAYVQLHLRSPTFGRIEVLQTITPIEPMLQKVVHRFYAPRLLGPIMKFVIFGESVMFERDVNMWNHKMYRNKPQLVKEESVIRNFRNWYSQFYSQNSKPFSEAYGSLNW